MIDFFMVKLNQYGTQFSAVHRNNYSDEIIFVENRILWTKLNNAYENECTKYYVVMF